MRNNRGIATIMMVFLVSVVALFILAAWQSRLLISIQRNQSLTDTVSVGYKAESEIYDWIAKFIGNYPNIYASSLNGTPCNLLDEPIPNKICVTGSTAGDEEILDIKAARPFASTNLQLARTKTGATNTLERVEIIMGLDCSGSMNQFSRIQSLQTALLSFIENIRSSPDADKFYLGMIPFKKSAAWAFEDQPVNDIDLFYNQIKNASQGGSDWTNTGGSPLCTVPGLNNCPLGNCPAETNMGSPGIKAMEYFENNPVDADKVLRSFVLFTDGLPNTSNSNFSCSTNACSSPENQGSCLADAIDYLKCSLAENQTFWKPGSLGKKPIDVDVYAVTVAQPPSNQKENEAFVATMNVFNSENFVKKSFANSDATQLSTIFDDIFMEIATSAQKLKIQKIIPTPEP